MWQLLGWIILDFGYVCTYFNLILQWMNIIDYLLQHPCHSHILHIYPLMLRIIIFTYYQECMTLNQHALLFLKNIKSTLWHPGTRSCKHLIFLLIFSLLTWFTDQNKGKQKELLLSSSIDVPCNSQFIHCLYGLKLAKIQTLSAMLWLSVAWPLFALTWIILSGFPSSFSLLLTFFPLLDLWKCIYQITNEAVTHRDS